MMAETKPSTEGLQDKSQKIQQQDKDPEHRKKR